MRRNNSYRWIGIIVIVLVFSVLMFFSVATEPYSSARNQANKIAKKAYNIDSTDYFGNYTRKKHYYSVGGYNKKGKYEYVVIDAKTGDLKMYKPNRYNRQYVTNKVKKNDGIKKITHVNLGIHDNKPVWEVAFTNKNKTVGYQLIDYKSGKTIQTTNNI